MNTRLPRLLLFTLLGSTALIKAQRPPEAKLGASAPEKEFQRLANTALAAPPELASDILLRLVESNAVKGRERKRELLRQAFDLAQRAKFPLKVQPLRDGCPSDSDAGSLIASLFTANLDTLSLRCRAVREMLRIDPAAALDEFFTRIRIPQILALDCTRAFGYSFDEYYALVADVAKTAFSEAERRDSKPALFLETHVRAIISPFQINGLTKAIVSSNLSDTEFERLVGAFASGLKSMNTDARSFSSTIPDVSTSVLRISEECRRRSVAGQDLVDAYRTYLTKHMSASRCEEDADAHGNWVDEVARMRVFFNEKLRLSSPGAEAVPQIEPDEVNASTTGGRAQIRLYWRPGQPDCDLLAGIKQLRFGLTKEQEEAVTARASGGGSPYLTLEERKDPQWEIAFRDFVNKLENRRKDFSDSESNHFHMVCLTYWPLVELAPPGNLQMVVVKSFVEFLKQSQMERTSPPEWMLQFSRLLEHEHGTPEGKGSIREEIQRSGDLTMNLYIEIERITGKRP